MEEFGEMGRGETPDDLECEEEDLLDDVMLDEETMKLLQSRCSCD